MVQIVDVPCPSSDSPPTLSYDPEWLAITRAFNPFMSNNKPQLEYPDEPTARAAVQRELEWVRTHVFGGDEEGGGGGGSVRVKKVEDVQVFVKAAPGPGEEGSQGKTQRTCLIRSFSRPKRNMTVILRVCSSDGARSGGRVVFHELTEQ